MHEATIICNGRSEIPSASAQVTSLLTQQSFQDSTGKPHGYEIEVRPNTRGKRTPTQNNAMHLWCEWVAVALNEAGYTCKCEIMREGAEIPWTKAMVKDQIWHPVQKAITGHDSSTQPGKMQYGEIYEVINQHLSTKGISVEWPQL